MKTLSMHVAKDAISGVVIEVSTGIILTAKLDKSNRTIDMTKALQRLNKALVELLKENQSAILTPIKSEGQVELDIPTLITKVNGQIFLEDNDDIDCGTFWARMTNYFNTSTLLQIETEKNLFFIKVEIQSGWTEIDLKS